MKWILEFFRSSIGQKVIMSLTGLFLILYLVIHLIANWQLLIDDGGETFNRLAHFMEGNALVQFIAKGLYLAFLLHIIQGIILWWDNRQARGSISYKQKSGSDTSLASRHMMLFGTLILAFLLIHLYDFWWDLKFNHDAFNTVTYDGGVEMIDLHARAESKFNNPVIIIIYLIGLVVLAFHLWHGFQSAFQTLGLRHPKYTPIIKFLGKAYAIVVPLLFAVIPLWMYFDKG